jgi:N-dimethylarginine dimethylaminohydrolase
MLAANPHAFRITPEMMGQNVFNGGEVDSMKARFQHLYMCEKVDCDVLTIPGNLPDVVFLANAGLVLKRLPEKVILMSNMKYPSRQKETGPLEKEFVKMGYKTIKFTDEVFEGQGEARWCQEGHVLLVGYGFRSTVRTVTLLRKLLNEVYASYNVLPPTVVGLKLETPLFYHMDMAMLVVNANHVVVHETAFSQQTVKKMRTFVKVAQIRVADPFCLNGICTKTKLFVHALTPPVRSLLKAVTGLTIVENDVSEFEKAGGSLRCMILDA